MDSKVTEFVGVSSPHLSHVLSNRIIQKEKIIMSNLYPSLPIS